MFTSTDSSTPVRFQAAITKAAGSLHVEACNIDVDDYEDLRLCKRELLRTPAPVAVSAWGGPDEDRVLTRIEEGVWRIEWRSETLYMVSATWKLGYSDEHRSWIVARDRETAHAFILDVARVTNDPRDAILVFHGSCWQRSHELWLETQKASFDELVLANSLKDQIREDFSSKSSACRASTCRASRRATSPKRRTCAACSIARASSGRASSCSRTSTRSSTRRTARSF